MLDKNVLTFYNSKHKKYVYNFLHKMTNYWEKQISNYKYTIIIHKRKLK